jgi:phage terminase large subunit
MYGAALKLQACRDREVIISGPSETGKTLACLIYLNNLALTYPGMQATIIRKVRKTMDSSVLQTFRQRVVANDPRVHAYGGETPQWFQYTNGSRVWVAGMDDSGKVLSSERDLIYVNQAEELTLEDWETLTTRVTGRAGNMPWAQVVGDCNPGSAFHWIKRREGLTLLESRHEDNPALFDQATGEITARGAATMATLDRLTGVRKDRLRYGRWVNAEGAVYEFDAAAHLIEPFEIPYQWRRLRAVDFGYTNPFVCLWGAVDPDGRLYVYKQLYMTGRTVRTHSATIKAHSGGEAYEATVADHDAEDAATLRENGIDSEPAYKAISAGVQWVQDRLARAGDGKPRLYVFRHSLIETDDSLLTRHRVVNLEQEFDVYVWPKGADGKPLKETPVDDNNHALDALRYMVAYLDSSAAGEAHWGESPTAGYRGR